MKPPSKFHSAIPGLKQRGVVLFFALIALLAMSLAAVALIRSVDTGTMIAGNLALKQSATTSSDTGVETAITWLSGISAANNGVDAYVIAAHPFNITDATNGYYASYDPAMSLTDGVAIQWDNDDSAAVDPDGAENPIPDSSGNRTRFIIQRMCRTAGVMMKDANCLLSSTVNNNFGQNIQLAPEFFKPTLVQAPQIRITTQTIGPRNTISYVQAFVF
jgi:Tfp pilus assembly protein PilX